MSNKSHLFVSVLVAAVGGFVLAAIPPYIKVCSKNDPEITKCIIDSVVSLRSRLKDGISELNVPPIEPLLLDEIKLRSGPDQAKIDANITNAKVWGPSGFEIIDLKANLKKNRYVFRVNVPNIYFEGDYDIDMSVLILKYNGKGPITGNFTASDVVQTDAKNNSTFEENKIVGGYRVDINYIRTQVAILHGNMLLCSGNIIRRDVILSVAHCLFGQVTQNLRVRSGSNFYNLLGRVVRVLRVHLHPLFVHDDPRFFYDIALMFLVEDATATGIAAEEILLWNADAVFPSGTVATFSGWGATYENGPPSTSLNTVSMSVISGVTCDYLYGLHTSDHSICTAYPPGGRDGCTGDAGAGLVILGQLAGLYSFGNGCGKPNTPSGFTSIPKYRHWIQTEAHI